MARPSSADARLRADLDACGAILAAGSRSFHAASLLLPARVRAPATALYAFCREADDVIDRSRDSEALGGLVRRLDGAYAQRPADSPVDRAFATAVAAARIPRAIPDALIEGFAWDAEGRRYDDLRALEAYGVRVAGTVGLMMALVMGVRQASALARALDLGVAMQFTNIARDVGEDARMGRFYLPLDWCAEAGVDVAAFLREPRFTPALGEVVRRLLAEAERRYAAADEGIAALPAACRPSIMAARSIYAAIGDEVARAGHDSVSRRAVVSAAVKIRLLAASLACLAPALPRAAPASHADGPCARRLIEAVAVISEPAVARPAFGERVGGVAEAFARLERRQVAGGAAGRG